MLAPGATSRSFSTIAPESWRLCDSGRGLQSTWRMFISEAVPCRWRSDRAGRGHGGKVLVVVEHVVEKVRQRVHGHECDDFDDVGIRVTSIADGLQVGVTD